jgi:hypothetical protein
MFADLRPLKAGERPNGRRAEWREAKAPKGSPGI